MGCIECGGDDDQFCESCKAEYDKLHIERIDTQSEINMKMKVYLINSDLEDLEYYKKVIDGKIAAFKMEAALDKLRSQQPKEEPK